MHWMLALMNWSDGHGAFCYADKHPGETRQLQTIRSQSFHDEPTGFPKKLFVAWIEPDRLSGDPGFYECLALASGYEEQLYIIASIRNMETFSIVPGGKLRDCRAHMNLESSSTLFGSSPQAMSTDSSTSSSPPAKRARTSDLAPDRFTATSEAGPSSGPSGAAVGSLLPGTRRRT